ncbi:MAG: hypothetical protein H6978_02815 [Gammaproteobacteria bacterium]|nr:hypothetical protein [Gammaproteobacteria bacterium]
MKKFILRGNKNLLALALSTPLLLSTPAIALQLGTPVSRSNTGEPLSLDIGMYGGRASLDRLDTIEFIPDLASGIDDDTLRLVQALRGAVAHEDGRSYIHVSSSLPIDRSQFTFRMRVHAGRETLIRRYAIELPAAGTAAATNRRPSTTATASRLELNGDAYGPIRAGETLWPIARAVRARIGGNAFDIMQQLLADNPDAFINNDINRLRTGAILVLPTAAVRNVAAVSAAPAVVSEAVAAPAPVAPEPEPLTQPAAPEVAVDWRTRDPELAREIDRLSDKFASIRARYSEQTGSEVVTPAVTRVAAPRPSPVAAVEAVAEQTIEVAPVVAPVEVAAAVEPEETSATVLTRIPEERSAAMDSNAVRIGHIAFAVVALFGIVLGVLGLMHRRNQSTKREVDKAAHKIAEADRKLAVSQKAMHRLEMEKQVRRIVKRKSRSDEPAEPMAPIKSNPTMVDVDSEITRGHYDRAAAMLERMLELEPNQLPQMLKLAEVYFLSERVQGFLALAATLRNDYRADIKDADWQKVVRMGRKLSPGDPLFGNLKLSKAS